MRRLPSVTIGVLAAIAVVSGATLGIDSALGNGGKGKRVMYRGALAGSDAGQDIQFDAELEPLLFRLTSVRNRSRVVRIRIRNTGAAPLALSAASDVVQAQLPGGSTLAGLLDLAARDAQAWDGLPADVRSAIVYPRTVPAGEEESVFVFWPVSSATDVPTAFRYTIASRPDRPVVIRDVSAAVGR